MSNQGEHDQADRREGPEPNVELRARQYAALAAIQDLGGDIDEDPEETRKLLAEARAAVARDRGKTQG